MCFCATSVTRFVRRSIFPSNFLRRLLQKMHSSLSNKTELAPGAEERLDDDQTATEPAASILEDSEEAFFFAMRVTGMNLRLQE
jgi:hypothetical protein